jgi:MarR family transcriptional regulator, lower aerobic nicotinate degradation pathway regulator
MSASAELLVSPQYGVLVAPSDFGGLAPHELAARLQMDRSHVSAYVDALRKRGWVVRVPDDADRRRVTVHLTDEGRALVTQLNAAAADSQRDFLGELSAAEQRTLRTLLMKIIVSAESSDVSADEFEKTEGTTP